RDQRVQPQKTKKKQRKETRATDSNAVTRDHNTLSTIEKSRSGNHSLRFRGSHLGVNPDRLRFDHVEARGDQLGVMYEAKNLGHRNNDVGSEKLTSIHRKADEDDHLHPDSDISPQFSLSK
ncbi:unnamed protein product, partial [Ilex paraguariensis]